MEAIFRYRTRADESIETRHQQIVAGLSRIAPPWGLRGEDLPAAPDIGANLLTGVNLTPLLGSGLTGGLYYHFRRASYLRDRSDFDDLMTIEVDPEKADYAVLARDIFPRYVKAFAPYRGTIIVHKGLRREDWTEVVRLGKETGKDVDGRDGVYRINSVNYFDRELCRRAFNLSPEQIVDRLKDKVESASLLLDGVLIIVTSQLLDTAMLKSIDRTVRNALGV